MKYLMILLVGACLLLTLVPAMADQAADEAAIRELNKQIYALANKHDVKAYIELFVDDYENWSGSLKERPAWEKYYTERWGRQKDLQYEMLEEIGIVFVTSDVAIYKYRGKTTGRLDSNGKQLPPLKRLWADVYVKKNGKWLCAAAFDRPIEE